MTIQKDFTEKEYKDIQTESHQFHKSYMEIMGNFEEKENKLNEQSIGLFTTFLTSVGVIAGFGFAALGNVANQTLFFAGESLLLFLIVIGLFILFSYNKSRENKIREDGNDWHLLLSPRLLLYKKFLTLEISKKELYQELNKDDKKIFNFQQPSREKILNLDRYFLSALIILIVGIILLLTSFMNFSFPKRYSHDSLSHQIRLRMR